jgi:energy-coupling factor transporter ATP-binding protein EcfA2
VYLRRTPIQSGENESVDTLRRRTRFRSHRERAWWLLVVAAGAAVAWAVAQVLQWPVAARATLAGLAAAVTVLVPELRALGARADRRDQLLARLEVPGRGQALPRVRDASVDQWRVHAARTLVPYIPRDAETAVDAALSARRPILLVGHSMAGKTRLAAERLNHLMPDAQLLAPRPGPALRDLVVDARLDMTGVVVWLDDLERFLRGDSALDVGLLEQMVRAGAAVVATIRLSELEGYRPRNNIRPPEWEVLRRFERVTLQRKNTKGERDRVRAVVTDPAVLAGVERYGLAEYLGAGPDAVERYDDGETICPIGQALVRAAVDWRRAGLTQLVSLPELQAALPIYLAGRPEVICDDAAVEDGLRWATDRINETVALLLPHQRPGDDGRHTPDRLYEVFEYLIDVIGAREEAAIPAAMWRRVARAAGAEARDVARAAGWTFAGRSRVLSEVASWLAGPVTDSPQLLVLTGDPGSGKTTVLTALALLADPVTRNLVQVDPEQPRVKLPAIDLQTKARSLTPDELLRELCAAAGQAAPVVAVSDGLMMLLLQALAERRRPFVAVVDAIDEATEPQRMAEMISEVAMVARGLPLRLLVSTRRMLLPRFHGGAVLDLDDSAYQDADDIVQFAREQLLARGSPYEAQPAELVDRVAHAVAARSSGSFLVARLALEWLVMSGRVIDADDPLSALIPPSLSTAIQELLAQLGPDEPAARELLGTLALGPAAGYTVEEWAAASLQGDRSFDSTVFERIYPVLSKLLTASSEGEGKQPRYRFLHDAVREFFRRG